MANEMKLLKARVRWMEGYANDPTLEVLVDKMPDLKDLRYQRKGFLYYAELGGYVNFYSCSGPSQGFGGRNFELTMIDGEMVTLKGPWSSRAAVMNSVGFGPCLDVSIIDEPDSYERGYTFFSGHVTLDFIESAKHLVEIGDGFNVKYGAGAGYVEFPEGSCFTFFAQPDGCYSPAVLLPDGEVWVKNVRTEEKSSSGNLSAEQSIIIG